MVYIIMIRLSCKYCNFVHIHSDATHNYKHFSDGKHHRSIVDPHSGGSSCTAYSCTTHNYVQL